jgi:hypothetical protein
LPESNDEGNITEMLSSGKLMKQLAERFPEHRNYSLNPKKNG